MPLQVVKDFLGCIAVAQDAGYEQPVEGLPEVVGLTTGGSHASPEVMGDVVTFQADGLCPPADVTHEVRERILRKSSAAQHPSLELRSHVARRIPAECLKRG